MLVFGANDFGAALLPAGRLLGYRTTLCDARPAFARQDRFLAADEVVVSWPQHYLLAEAAAGRLDGRTVVCVLSHDPKFDLPLLASALELDLAYLGAMGSRNSHRHRVSELLDAGADPESVARMHAPIGLDLGAVTPGEVAVSIAAEIVAALRGTASRSVSNASTGSRSTPRSLRDGSGTIHHDTLIPA
jgi:xanthine dehydrogenase accessory factor